MYRETLTLRQVAARIAALPHDAHLWTVLMVEQEESDQRQKEAEITATLAKFQPSKEV